MEDIQVALAERVAEQHRHHPKAQFFWVWAVLLLMTAIEVYLGISEHGTGAHADDADGAFAPEGRADHRIFHAHEI